MWGFFAFNLNAFNALQFMYSDTTNNSKIIHKNKIALLQMLPMIAINYYIKSSMLPRS